MTTRPKVGDKIRVTSEGVVKRELGGTSQYGSGRTRLMVEVEEGKTRLLYWPPNTGITIEIIEPGYVEGGVYLDNDGDFYVYKGDAGLFLVDRFSGTERTVSDDYPTKPVLKVGG